MVDDVVDTVPIDAVVGMDGEVAKADGPAESVGDSFVDQSLAGEDSEHIAHGLGRRSIGVGEKVCPQIDAQLDRALQVDAQDVLAIEIIGKFGRAGRSLRFNPCEATKERIEFAGDKVLIHDWWQEIAVGVIRAGPRRPEQGQPANRGPVRGAVRACPDRIEE